MSTQYTDSNVPGVIVTRYQGPDEQTIEFGGVLRALSLDEAAALAELLRRAVLESGEPRIGSLDMDQYQTWTHSVAAYKETGTFGADYPVLGLLSEAGELAGKLAKYIRDDGKLSELREAVIKELGDVLWMTARIALHVNITLTEVARRNIEKIEDRKRRGVIGGSGDDR